jgi:hypothetical protein
MQLPPSVISLAVPLFEVESGRKWKRYDTRLDRRGQK